MSDPGRSPARDPEAGRGAGGPAGRARRSAVTEFGAALLLAAAAWLAAACGGKRAPEAGAPAPGGAEAAPEARPEPETPGRWYWVYVANRGSDVVSRVRFGPEGAAYEKPVEVGVMPTEIDGPVGIGVAADGEHWYLTTARGTPSGRLWKYETGTDRQVASVALGSSPGPVELAPDGGEAWVPTASGGGGSPSAVSVVRTGTMTEVARLAACGRPGATRVLRSGGRTYATCAADDLLVEIAAGSGGRRRRRALRLAPRREPEPPGEGARPRGGGGPDGAPRCRPAAAVAGRGDRIWVACRGSDEVVEVGTGELRVRRRLRVGSGPSALAVTPDGGTLLAANRDGGTLSVVDLEEGGEAALLGTSRPEPRAVAVSDDGRYAFVGNGAGGRTRSTVDVFDLRALVRVAEVEVEHGAAGLAFWRSLPVRR